MSSYKDLTLIQVYRPCHLTNPTNRIIPNGKTTPAVLLPLIAK